MRIQLITERDLQSSQFPNLTINHFLTPQAIDEFDLNVIDLTSESLWMNKHNGTDRVNSTNDFKSIFKMVGSSSLAKVLYVLPPQLQYHYYFSYSKYQFSMWIKDCIESVLLPILDTVVFPAASIFNLQFENTRTVINGIEYCADFFFTCSCNGALSQSDHSAKTTTIKLDEERIFVTTLQIFESFASMTNFIHNIIYPPERNDFPKWFTSIQFGDDADQYRIIQEQMDLIDQAEKKKQIAEAKLSENDEYKSILYTNGDELVRVVYKILQQLLSCDLSAFVDEKREDFLIEKEECTFIGEIKGINTNVRYEHVTQCNLHLSQYMDQLEEQGKQETVKQLLIINPFRKTDPAQRDPVHEKQIQLAIKSDCLIIETATLLKVFETFLAGSVTANQCVSVFMNHSGLLCLDMFNNEE